MWWCWLVLRRRRNRRRIWFMGRYGGGVEEGSVEPRQIDSPSTDRLNREIVRVGVRLGWIGSQLRSAARMRLGGEVR